MTNSAMKLLKIAYRNVLISLSDNRAQNALKSDKSFQQVFLTQLSVYNFLFDVVKENRAAEAESSDGSAGDEKTESLDEFCARSDFSLETNNVLEFLERFNAISHRRCVIKDLALRSTEMSDIQDDLNYFTVFVNNTLSIDLTQVNSVDLKRNYDIPVVNAVEDHEEEHDRLPTNKDFADLGRNSWIENRANAQLMREVLDNRIYLFTSKPKSVIVLKWISLFVLGLASLVNLVFLGLILYSTFSSRNTSIPSRNQLGNMALWVVVILALSTFSFCREIQKLFMSIKGNGATFLLVGQTIATGHPSDNKNKIFNNDNLKFYFNWHMICLVWFFSVIILSTPIQKFINNTDSELLDVFDFSVAVAYIVAYVLVAAVIVAALVINPKKDLQRILNRKYEIRREVSDQVSEHDASKAQV